MIEAVNSVLSNTSATRIVAEQQTTTRSFAANPERTQEIARAPFVSPFVSIDRNSNRAILQIRDSSTGDVVRQFPTEGQLRAYQTAQELSNRQAAQQTSSSSQGEVSSLPAPSTQSPSAQSDGISAPEATSIQTEA